MKKRFFVLAFALAFAVGLAWAGHGQKMDVASHVVKLKAELKLTDQQAEKVQVVLEDIHQRKMAAKQKAGGQESAAFREQYKKLMEERDARLKEILTPEQFARYQQLQAEHAKEQGGRQKK